MNGSPTRSPVSRRIDLAGIASRNSALLALAGVMFVIVIYTAMRNGIFLSAGNLTNILLQSSVLCVLAAGTTMLMISGGIDLSIGSMMAVCAIVGAKLMESGQPLFLALLLPLLLGILIGAGNGALAAWSPTHPFIVTLGVGMLLQGVAIVITEGLPLSNLNADFVAFASSKLLGIAYPVYVAAFIAGLVALILKYTVFGRRLYYLGGNERAAMLSGIKVKRKKVQLYAFNGLLVAIAGLLLSSRVASASGAMGVGFEMQAIAAVAVGGVPLAGGRGGMTGTILGVLLLGIIANSLNLLGISSGWQYVLQGAVIVVAVMTMRSGNR